jgi:hypothetical protein
MGRAILGVIAGYVVWTVLWLAGNNLIFAGAAETVAGGQKLAKVGTLLGILVLSVVCSLAAGAVTAAVARPRVRVSVLVMALLLLVTGVGVQASIWNLMPVWYHLVFLALIVPVCLVGARPVDSALHAGRWIGTDGTPEESNG